MTRPDYVTGSSGFLGRHLVARLKGDVIKIPHLDIAESNLVDFRNFFFLSTYGNMAHHDDKAALLRANITDLTHVLNSIRRFGLNCDLLVFVSSSSVTLKVQTPYSRLKRAAEEMLQAMPVPSCIVRPFSVIGRGEQKEHLIPTLIRSCLEGEQMDFVPHATHDYIDVSDVVDGLLLLAAHKATGIFELGKGVPVSNYEVRQIVEGVTGKRANVRLVDKLRSYDTPEWKSTNSNAELHGWYPKKSLVQSIEEMVEAHQ